MVLWPSRKVKDPGAQGVPSWAQRMWQQIQFVGIWCWFQDRANLCLLSPCPMRPHPHRPHHNYFSIFPERPNFFCQHNPTNNLAKSRYPRGYRTQLDLKVRSLCCIWRFGLFVEEPDFYDTSFRRVVGERWRPYGSRKPRIKMLKYSICLSIYVYT